MLQNKLGPDAGDGPILPLAVLVPDELDEPPSAADVQEYAR